MRSCWTRVGPRSREREGHTAQGEATRRQKQKSVMRLQAKGCQGSPATTRRGERPGGPSPGPSEAAWSRDTVNLDFWSLEL